MTSPMIVIGQLVTYKGLVGMTSLMPFNFTIHLCIKGAHNFLGIMGKRGKASWLARVDRCYSPLNMNQGINLVSYFIHGYSVGLGHAHV
jgi:hypothetical protein